MKTRQFKKVLHILIIVTIFSLLVFTQGKTVGAAAPTDLHPDLNVKLYEASTNKTELTVDEFKDSFTTNKSAFIFALEITANNADVEIGTIELNLDFNEELFKIQHIGSATMGSNWDEKYIWKFSKENQNTVSGITNASDHGLPNILFKTGVSQPVIKQLVFTFIEGKTISDITEDTSLVFGLNNYLFSWLGDESVTVSYENTNISVESSSIGDVSVDPNPELASINILGGVTGQIVIDKITAFKPTINPNEFTADITLAYADKFQPLNIVSIVPVESKATVVVTGNVATDGSPFKTSDPRSEISITITHQGVTNTYKLLIQVIEEANTENSLADLSVYYPSGSNLITGFDSNTKNYSIAVPYDKTSVTIAAFVSKDSRATVLIDGSAPTLSTVDLNNKYSYDITGLQEGVERTVSIVVTAENETINTYDVKITRENRSSENQINSLLIKVTGRSPAITGLITGDLISATIPEYDGDSISFNFEINVPTAATKVRYSLGDDIWTLTSKVVDGKYATANITSLDRGTNKQILIEVTAQNDATRVYTLDLDRKKSSNTTLTRVDVSQGTYTEPAQRVGNVFTFNSSGTSDFQILPILPSTEDSTFVIRKGSNSGDIVAGSIAYSDLAIGNNMFYVIVTAANGTNTAEYEVNLYKRSISNDIVNVSLKNASNNEILGTWNLDGYKYVNNFAWQQPSTKVELIIETSDKSEITVTTSGISYSYVGTGKNTISVIHTYSGTASSTLAFNITVKAEDVTNSTTLDFMAIQGAADSEARLDSISVSGIPVPEFDLDTYTYLENIIVDRKLTSVNLSVVKHSSVSDKVTVTYNGLSDPTVPINIPGAVTQIKIVVTAQSGDQKTYTINVLAGDDNNEVINITFDGITDFTFDSSTQNYILTSPASYEKTTIKVSKNSLSYSKVYIDGVYYANGEANITLKVGVTTVQVYVKSETGVDGKLYTFNITRTTPRSEKTLASLDVKLDGIPLDLKSKSDSSLIGFRSSTFDYTLRVDYIVSSILVEASVPSGNGSRIVSGTGQKTLTNKLTTITIIVQAEDGTQSNYTIEVTKADDDNKIIKVLIGGKEYEIASFLGTETDMYKVLNITDLYPYSQKQLKVQFVLSNQYATITSTLDVNGNWNLIDGVNTLEFYAVSQAGTNGQKYKVNIERTLPNNNTSLKSLTITNGSTNYAVDGFNSEAGSSGYTIRVDKSINSLNFSALANGLNAKVEYSPSQTVSLSTFKTNVTVKVTAEDGSIGIHTIEVIKANNNREISDIFVGGSSLIDVDLNPFDPAQYNYDLGSFPYATSTIKLNVLLVDTSAVVRINGNIVSGIKDINLVVGSNTITILVKSEFENETNSAGVTYTLSVIRGSANTNNEITGITVNGIIVNGFSTSNPETVYLPSGTTIAELLVQGKHELATVTYDGSTDGSITLSGSIKKTVIVRVTSESGVSKNYYVSVQAANTNNEIIDISLSGIDSTLFTFNKDTKTYTIEVPYAVETTTVTVYTPDGVKSTITGAGTHNLTANNVYKIIVYATSEADIPGEQYTILITRNEASSDTNISDLQIYKGSLINSVNALIPNPFDPLKNSYEFRVNNDVTDILITAKKANQEIVSGTGIKALLMDVNTFTITITAEDGLSNRTINIKITRANDNNNITDIQIDGVSQTASDKGIYDEIIYSNEADPLPYQTKKINITGILEDSSAKLFIDGSNVLSTDYTLKEGQNTIVIYAVSEYGTKGREIHITYYRLSAQKDTTLDDLYVEQEDGTRINFDGGLFNKNIQNYIVTLSETDSYSRVNIIATGDNSPYKVVSGDTGLKSLNWTGTSLNHKFIIMVTAEDGSIETYSITFLKNSSLNSSTGFKSFWITDTDSKTYLEVKNNGNINQGSIEIPYSISSLFFGLVTDDPNATIKWTNGNAGSNLFKAGETKVITFQVIAQDGTLGTEYKVSVTREIAKTDQSLSLLSVKDIQGKEYITFPNPDGSRVFKVRVNDNIEYVNIFSDVLKENNSTIVTKLSGVTIESSQTITLQIFVRAEDGSMDKPYTIHIQRANNNASIDNVQVDAVNIDLSLFDLDIISGKYVYRYDGADTTKSSINLKVTPTDAKATVTGGGKLDLDFGSNSYDFFVTAQDQTTVGDTYSIVIEKVAREENELEDLFIIVDGKKIYINPIQNVNEVIVGKDVDKVTIGGVVPGGATTNGFKEYLITKDQETIKIIVTSESQVDKEYTIIINRKSSNNNIKTIEIDGTIYLLDDFIDNILYLDNVNWSKKNINILITPEDSKATVNGNGLITLVEGNNSIKFNVIAEDNTVGEVYTIIVFRSAVSTDATLKDLYVLVDGLKVAFNEGEFKTNVLNYNVIIDRNVSLSITATKNHSKAIITGETGLMDVSEITQGGKTEFKIFVTAEDQVTKLTYRITVEAKSKVASIEDILINDMNGNELSLSTPFDRTIINYSLTDVLYSVKYIQLTSTVLDQYAKIVVIDKDGKVLDINSMSLIVGENVFTIYALAEDGITKSDEYQLSVNRLNPDTDNLLNSLSVHRLVETGEALSFDEGLFSSLSNYYTIYLQSTDTITNLYIKATTSSSNAIITGDKLRILTSNNSNVLQVVVTAESGDTNTYYITVIRGGTGDGGTGGTDTKSDASILSINLFDKAMKNHLSFNKNIATQTPITVPYQVSTLNLIISAYPGATVTGNGSYEILPGETITINFKVTSADNTSTSFEYTVDVTREEQSKDNNLIELYVDIVNADNSTTRINLDPTKLLNEVSIGKDASKAIIGGKGELGTTVSGLGEYIVDLNEKVVSVIVSSPDGDDKVYIIKLNKQNDNTEFDSIKIDGEERLQDFIDGVLDLGTVMFSRKSLNIQAVAKDQYALVNNEARTITIEYQLTKTGLIEYSLYVVSENGTLGPKYTIRVERSLADTNANLSGLTVKDNETSELLTLSPAFNESIIKYNIDLTGKPTVKEILIEGIKANSNANVSGNGTHILKTEQGESSQTFVITVTAEDNTSVKKYEILVTRNVKPEDDNTVNTITLIGSDNKHYLGLDTRALNIFELSKYQYFISIPYSVKSLDLTIYNSNGATPYGDGKYEITDKTTELEFYMVSKSGIESGIYKVTIIREDPKTDNLLSELTINGKTIKDFNPNTFDYTIDVTSEEVSQILLNATPRDEYASMTGDIGTIELPHGITQWKIVVTAESGDIKTYTVNVNRLSGNNVINDISLNDRDINLGFDIDDLTYTYTVDYKTTSIVISAEKAHSKATLMGIGMKSLKAGSNYFTVYAIAENGDVGVAYQIEVIRENPSNDSLLKSLEIFEYKGGPQLNFLPAFDPYTYIYNIAIGPEDDLLTSLFINAEANSAYALGISGNGFKWLKAEVDGKFHNVLEIIVIAQDGITTTTYTVNVYRDVELSKVAEVGELALIGSDGINYLGTDNAAISNFNKNTLSYTLEVPYYLASITLNVAAQPASVYGAGTKSFGANKTLVFEMYVVSQDGTVQSDKYTITITKEVALTSNKLKSLMLNEQDLLNFDPNINQYSITLPIQKYTNILISATPEDKSATVSGDIGGQRLIEGTQTFAIIVTAQNGVNNTYTIIVNYVQSNALLEKLQVFTCDSKVFDPNNAKLFQGLTFDPVTFEYTLKVDKSTENVNISGAAQDLSNALVIGFGTYEVPNEGTKIDIFVQSADGQQLEKYVLNVIKEDLPSRNSKLKDLKINNGEYKLTFDPNIMSYTVTVGSSVNELDISAITEDPNAIVSVTGADQIDIGKNVLMVLVQAEDGSVSFYQLSVIRDSAPDYFLLVMLIVTFLVWVLTIVYFFIFAERRRNSKHRPVVV